ncbi:MAG: DinB family protein [Bacteroidota bacterium]
MNEVLKETLWRQFGASIQMLENAITMWPDNDWNADKKYFYMAYHTLIFLDYYSNVPAKHFASSLPFTFTNEANIPEDALDSQVPDRFYTKKELLAYLQESRLKVLKVITNLQDDLHEHWIEVDDDRNYPVVELLMYNMRHVQHHAAQLNLLLRQKMGDAPQWVSKDKSDL